MTIITLREGGRLPVQASSPSYGAKLHAAALRLIDNWNRRKTERMLEGLPVDIRKDIGWPASDEVTLRH
ncbi:hypothetical protein [Neorhizobium alkalisoli]|jgi:hypothetical protein|uniref:DUF1127 domain-containing protein n=1 Tax=Neorhizobium alkalisoli TaxID=528178 RepID=A0A561QV59_9HYPH|nr:hypothetical protein [Neorhizobium alkalisoli]TWF54260.1 hypothetical protein FHW37_103123 [Neorhizobium alkalisoli]